MQSNGLESRELRIGNFVNWGGHEIPVEGHDIAYLSKMEKEKQGTENYKAIPLTEEWLIRFGFEKRKEVTWSFGYEKQFNVYSKDDLTFNGVQCAWWFNGLLRNQPEYVHQLQNLYFSLTNSELEIKS
jgi:hypothetical protein